MDNRKNSILLIDDDKNTCIILSNILSDAGYKVICCKTGNNALEKFEKEHFHAVLVDYNLPDLNGMDLVRKLKQINNNSCIILITGHASLDSALEAIKEDVYDYLVKPVAPDNLLKVLKKGIDRQNLVVENQRLLIELRNRNKDLSMLSVTDDLTGLYNRRYFYTKLDDEMTRARRQKHPLALLLIDLDNFKKYNDTQGHLEGDKLLKELGLIILHNIRDKVDYGFRYGGDEFAVILSEADEEVAKVAAERFRTIFNDLDFKDVGISVGITTYDINDSGESIIERADAAMYSAKSAGGNSFSTI